MAEIELRNYIDLNKVTWRVRRAMPRAIQAGLDIWEDESVSRTPTRSGRLRNSAYTTVESRDKGRIGYSADYAVYVHEILDAEHPIGGPKFLERAMKHPIVRAEIRREIENHLSRSLR